MADEGTPAVWRLDSQGNLLSEQIIEVEGMGQVAKIRKDASSGFVLCSTAWSFIGEEEVNAVAVVKISDSLELEWSQVSITATLPQHLALPSPDVRDGGREQPGV